MPYLLIGDLTIVVQSVLNLSYSFKQGFVEQEKIEAPPTLQQVGRNLSTLSLACRFHYAYSKPDLVVASLLAACNAAKPLSLVDGSGNYKGKYVLESVDVSPIKTDGEGRSFSVDVNLALKEWRTAAPPQEQMSAATVSPFKKVKS
jgi:phage protein U